MDWKRLLAHVTGSVDHALLLRNEYLVTENRILRNQISGRVRLSDEERISLAEIGKRLGRRALLEVATLVTPGTILSWHRRLIARKFDGSQNRRTSGRPRTEAAVEDLVVQMARENRSWGYDRVQGAMANLGHVLSDATVSNFLKRNGIAPAPERGKHTAWKDFIGRHRETMAATDFFTAEVWTCVGLVTFYVLFFIRLHSRQIQIAGVTAHPTDAWMKQIARNVTMDGQEILAGCQYLLHESRHQVHRGL